VPLNLPEALECSLAYLWHTVLEQLLYGGEELHEGILVGGLPLGCASECCGSVFLVPGEEVQELDLQLGGLIHQPFLQVFDDVLDADSVREGL
jgi:hypothetical protein